jgi:hypothetical protein
VGDIDDHIPFYVMPGVVGCRNVLTGEIFCLAEKESPDLYINAVSLIEESINREEAEHLSRKFKGLSRGVFDSSSGVRSDPEVLVSISDNGRSIKDLLSDYGINDPKQIFWYRILLSSSYRHIFENFFSFKGHDLESGREGFFKLNLHYFQPTDQFYIIFFLRRLKLKDIDLVKRFFNQYGYYGVQMLVISEQSGIDILEIMMKFFALDSYFSQPDIGQEILEIFISIINETCNIDSFLDNSSLDFDKNELQMIAASMRKRASGILISLLDEFLKGINHLSVEDIFEKLARVRSENILLAETYKELKRLGKVTGVEDFLQISLREGDPNDPRLHELYRQNYPNPQRAENLIMKMLADSKKPGFRLQVMEYNGQIVGAVYVVEDREKKRVYIGGLNSNESEGLKSLQAGQYIISILEDEYFSEGWTIEATALLRLSALHIMKRNFIGVEDLGLSEDGEIRLRLLRNGAWEFESKDKEKFSQSKIVEMAEQKLVEKNGEIAVFLTKNENELPKELSEGYVITQMFSKDDKVYFLLVKFTPPQTQTKDSQK